jgi:hypothetical protein
LENWFWGLSLIALSIAMHSTAVVFMAMGLAALRKHIGHRVHHRPRRSLMALIVLISVGAMLLAALHGLEAGIWAVAYRELCAMTSFGDAFLYSIDSMTTRGANVLRLEHPFRMMGAIESVCGMLLFGISTAFLFAMMRGYWDLVTNLLPRRR